MWDGAYAGYAAEGLVRLLGFSRLEQGEAAYGSAISRSVSLIIRFGSAIVRCSLWGRRAAAKAPGRR